jgi:hypothetical protein
LVFVWHTVDYVFQYKYVSAARRPIIQIKFFNKFRGNRPKIFYTVVSKVKILHNSGTLLLLDTSHPHIFFPYIYFNIIIINIRRVCECVGLCPYIYIYIYIYNLQFHCIVAYLICLRLGYGLDNRIIEVRFSALERDFSLLQRLQTSSEAQPVSCLMLTWAVSPLVKRAGREADYPSPSSAGG